MTPISSSCKAFDMPKFATKQPMLSPFLFLNMPPQASGFGLPKAVPSILHLIRLRIKGCHITSMILGALGWWVSILKAFSIIKSSIEDPVASFVRVPDKHTKCINHCFRCIYVWLDVIESAIVSCIPDWVDVLIIAEQITNLHWGLQLLWHTSKIESIEDMLFVFLMIPCNHSIKPKQRCNVKINGLLILVACNISHI